MADKNKVEKKMVNVRLPEDLVEYVSKLGFGNVSAGIVRALHEHREANQTSASPERKQSAG